MVESRFPISGGQAFWIGWLLVALIPLAWLSNWGYQNGSLAAFAISVIFLLLIIITLALKLFTKLWQPNESEDGSTKTTTFSQQSLSAVLGGLFGILIIKLSQWTTFSLLALPRQEVLAALGGNLPLFWNKFVNVIGASFAEEMFFLVALPFLIFMILEWVGSVFSPAKNPWFQILVVSVIVGPLFAWFHVGSAGVVAFLIAAAIFRIVNIVFVHGDRLLNIVPFASLTISFSFFMHMFNNIWALGGFGEFLSVMATQPVGWVVIAFLSVTFIAALNQIRVIITGKNRQ